MIAQTALQAYKLVCKTLHLQIELSPSRNNKVVYWNHQAVGTVTSRNSETVLCMTNHPRGHSGAGMAMYTISYAKEPSTVTDYSLYLILRLLCETAF
jgi:uncharacterized damage-inducible protein DinB